MKESGTVAQEPNSGYARLEQQIRWYDEKSGSAQRWYKRVKFLEFALGAFIPLTATVNGVLTAVIGAIVLVFEGLQQVNQWQHNWITYRSTCESLRHEKYSYLGRSGAYEGLDDAAAMRTLVERVEGLVSTEHSKWLSLQQYQLAQDKQNDKNAK